MEKRTMNREEALAFITKILPVWPDDLSTAALLGKQCQATGWYFSSVVGAQHAEPALVYVPKVRSFGPPGFITKRDWMANTALVYGPNNDAELEGDGDFAALNRGALQEKGDAEDTPTAIAVEHCPAGHTFARLTGEGQHPMDEDGEWMCPHCMASALSRIYGVLADYQSGD